MHLQKVISKKTFKQTNYLFVGNLSRIRIRIQIRIRIHWSEAWIRESRSGSGSTPKCHGSAILDFPRHVNKLWRGEKYRKMSTFRKTAAQLFPLSSEALLNSEILDSHLRARTVKKIVIDFPWSTLIKHEHHGHLS
jgi:hypothetical protein